MSVDQVGPLGGNYSARRGSILTASCFLSPSLWPLAPSLKNMTALLPYSACVCVCVCAVMCSCMYVCFPLHLTVLFLACLTHSQLTAFVFIRLLVCICQCVSLCVCSPSGLSDSSPACKLPAGLPLSCHSVRHSAAFKLNRSLGIIAGCGRPLFQSAATGAALTRTHSLSVCMCASVCGCLSACKTKGESK